MINESQEFKERELKYRAAPRSLEAFTALGQRLKGKFMLGAGADCYWSQPGMPDLPPVRHRYSQGHGELTIKKQVIEGSNIHRHEINLRLEDSQLREMEQMLPLMGYKPALRISKVAHIFYCPFVVLSWYSVLGMDGAMMHMEDGTPAQFVEIELREDLDWSTIASDWRQWSDCTPASHPLSMDFLEQLFTTDDFCGLVLCRWAAFLLAEGIVVHPPLPSSLWEMFGPKELT
jgi:adenylate cyclase class IV